MRTLRHTEFTALLARGDVSQAGFARLTGITTRQVDNGCRGRAVVPSWATAAKVPPASAGGKGPEGAPLAVTLQELSAETLAIMAEETELGWHAVLGVEQDAGTATVQHTMTRQALLYLPDTVVGSRLRWSASSAAVERACASLKGN
jgi:hypothetical protein